MPVDGAFTNFRMTQRLYEAAGADARLLEAYDRLIERVVLPFLKARLADARQVEAGSAIKVDAEGDADGDPKGDAEVQAARAAAPPITFHYQRPPSVRLQRPDASAYCREHRDAEYGHQVGEVNFWLPLTDPTRTHTTLWVERSPGAADFHPLEVGHGEIAAFHGTLCRHRVPPNTSTSTRVSLDFRVGVGDYFDPSWKLKEAKAQHTRRALTI